MPAKEEILARARATISANIVSTTEGKLLAAGGNQFRTLWVRDFCFSVPGLLADGHHELVARQLLLYFRFLGANGHLPRGLDVMNPKFRVLKNLVAKESISNANYGSKSIKPEYLGEHGTPAYDSNLLFILAALAFEKKTGAPLLEADALREILSPYLKDGGIVRQPPFSDWQDSVRREGPILFTQLLLLRCLLGLGEEKAAAHLRVEISKEFFQDGFFREQKNSAQLSLDSQITLLTEKSLFPELKHSELFFTLKAHPLWQLGKVPGRPVHPQHPNKSISWTTKLVGLRHYHDDFIWGWLTAEAYRTATLFGDTEEAQRILQNFAMAKEQNAFLSEIYSDQSSLAPAQTWIYRSESPFTWTAAKWIEALA